MAGRRAAKGAEVMSRTFTTDPTRQDLGQHPRPRSPARAAILSAVTMSFYGFWWWCDVNRQLRKLGEQVKPWRALAGVTVGWVALVPPFLSVLDTTGAIADAQRRASRSPTAQPRIALGVGSGGPGSVSWQLGRVAREPCVPPPAIRPHALR